VQSAGAAYRLKEQVFGAEFGQSGALQHLFLRYTQVASHPDGADRGLQPSSFGRNSNLAAGC